MKRVTDPPHLKTRYEVRYYCNNCHRFFQASFPFGEPASQPACHHCGVRTKKGDDIFKHFEAKTYEVGLFKED